MKTFFSLLLLSLCLFTAPHSQAQGNSAALFGNCMIDSLNGKERKKLAQWIFFAMSSHPEISQFSNVSDADRAETDKYIGALITRLMTKDCPAQAKQAMAESSSAIEQGFALVGQVAMQELMTNPSVANSVSQFEQYMDKGMFESLMGQ